MRLVDILVVLGVGFGIEVIPIAKWVFVDILWFRLIFEYGEQQNDE
jgi:hypothetical protein